MAYQPGKSSQDYSAIIMELGDILQQKVNDGIISIEQFTTLSQRLEAIQDLYEGEGYDTFKNQSQLMSSLTQLRSEINYISSRK